MVMHKTGIQRQQFIKGRDRKIDIYPTRGVLIHSVCVYIWTGTKKLSYSQCPADTKVWWGLHTFIWFQVYYNNNPSSAIIASSNYS